jgi:hypothetical protein
LNKPETTPPTYFHHTPDGTAGNACSSARRAITLAGACRSNRSKTAEQTGPLSPDLVLMPPGWEQRRHPERGGRKPTIDAAELHRLRDEEKLGPAAIARRLGIGRASVYRVLGRPTPPG